MTAEQILSAASGGKYFTVGTNYQGSFMAFKAINGDAVIKLNATGSTNVDGLAGREITIREGDVHWYRATLFDVVSGEVIAYDLN